MDRAAPIVLRPDIAVCPPNRAARAELVAEQLRERIISGALLRGQRLSRRELAREFGVPLEIVREAIRRIDPQGYVLSSARGQVVAPLRLHAEMKLKRRLSLESRLTQQAAPNLGRLGLRLLERLHDELTAAQRRRDILAIQRCNYRFHARLYQFAGRPDLMAQVQAIWADFPFDLMTTMPSRMTAVADEHETILAALAMRDASSAARAMRGHIVEGWRQFRLHYPFDDAPWEPRS